MKKGIFTLLFMVCMGANAQYKQPYFNLLGVENGLPADVILQKLEDKFGYLWLGTINGLVRYDGYRLKQYPILNEEGLPLKPQSINLLFEDDQGRLWAGISLHGFFLLDRQKDRFIFFSFGAENDRLLKRINFNYLLQDPQQKMVWLQGYEPARDKESIYSIDFSAKKIQVYNETAKGNYNIPVGKTLNMSLSADNKLWLTTDSTLRQFDPPTRSFKPFYVLPALPGGQRFGSVLADPGDPDILWINTIRNADPNKAGDKEVRGCMRFSIKTKTFSLSMPGSKGPGTIPLNCYHVFADSLKRIWVSAEGSIYLYDRKTAGFTGFPVSFPNSEAHSESVAADTDGHLWIRGSLGGLVFLDTRGGKYYPYEADGRPGSLPSNRVFRDLFFDRAGIFWVNIESEGIAWLDRKKTSFAPVPLLGSSPNGIQTLSAPQYAIVGTEGDSICYLKDTASLLSWNTLSNRITPIVMSDKKYYSFILNIDRSPDGRLWMACGPNGLLSYEPGTGLVKDFTNVAGDSISLSGLFIIDVAVDSKGIVWLATDNAGLMSFNPSSGKFKKYPYIINDGKRMTKDSLDDRTATCLYFARDGLLWVGTNNGGVNSFDPVTGKFRSYLNVKDAFFAITSIYEDNRNRLWVCTYLSGLFQLDRKTGRYRNYTEKDGLIHNTVYNMQEDASGQLWVTTPKGLTRINPDSNSISNFPSARPWIYEYTGRCLIDRNGIFTAAGKNGLIRFDPRKLGRSSRAPSVYIESVGFRPGGLTHDSLLFTAGREYVRMKYNENRISFQFVALHFADPEQNQYAYRLEGYDKDWIQAGSQRNVTYSNLPPGHYIFTVKAANSDGVWNETAARFAIRILPPWWKTWWAYCLYVLAAVGLVWIYIRLRSRALRRENLVLEQKVEHRTKQLQETIASLKETQAQLIQSEKMASLGELTAGIAHEIQNPLNFVNNFSDINKDLTDELQQELKEGKIADAIEIAKNIRDNEEKISHHGKRADAIVKSMLQHSRSGNGQKEPTDINALCDEYLRLAYHGLRAKDKSFNAKTETHFDNDIGRINVLQQDLGRVILNLVNNAFHAVTERKKKEEPGYMPTVIIRTRKAGSRVEISIKDNGAGIPDAIREKIFQPFFTTKPTGEGTGLGLSLSYDIITKGHGGTLRVLSEEGEMTEFIITLGD